MAHRRAKTLLALAAGLALLGALVAYVGPATILRALRDADPLLLALAAVTYALFFVARGVRWRSLLAAGAGDVSLATTTSVTAVGWLANSFLPLKGGDVLRAALVARRERISVGASAVSIALERVLDVVGLAIVATLALLLLLPAAGALPAWLGTAVEVAWILPAIAILSLALVVVFRDAAMRTAGRALGPLGRPGASLLGFLGTTVAGLDALARRPLLLAWLLPLTILVSILQALLFTFLVLAFLPGMLAPVAFGGSALFVLSFIIAITPGNVGTYEAAFVAIFVALGSPTDLAVAASILTHLATTLIVAVLGALGLLALGVSPSKLPLPAPSATGRSAP